MCRVSAILLFLLASLCWAGEVRAASEPDNGSAPVCIIATDEATAVQEIVRQVKTRSCERASGMGGLPVVWLVFEAPEGGFPADGLYRTNINKFTSIDFHTVGDKGAGATARHPDDARYTETGPMMVLDLPASASEAELLVVRVERAHSWIGIANARIVGPEAVRPWSDLSIALVALVLGMLLMPLIFDLAVYSVLRERFALMHAGMVCGMITYIAFSSGAITMVTSLPVPVVAVMASIGWVVGTVFSAIFAHDLIEPGKLGSRLRKGLILAGLYTAVVPLLFALQFDALHAIGNSAYFLSAIPVVILYCAAIGRAIRNGSRSAWFLAIAWVPIFIGVAEQSMRGMGFYDGPSDLTQGMYVTLALEVIIATLGVADRFLSLKHERDRARADARAMERVATQDSLTGTLNRRAIEPRFAELVDRGFHACALIDVDRFKGINDEFGHAKGDEVLQATARALDPDPNTLVARVGGEEFLLLMRGPDPFDRAERRRRAVTTRTLREVRGLERPVTASMGVVDFGALAGEGSVDFATIFSRADHLLYQAKDAGRNRAEYECLGHFEGGEPVAIQPSAA